MPNTAKQNMDFRRANTDRVIGLATTAKVINEPWVQHFIKAIALTDDPGLEEDLALALKPRAIEQLFRDIPFNNPTQAQLSEFLQMQHPMLFGIVPDLGLQFVQPIDWFNQHLLILGGTGTGKTNFLYAIILMAIRYGRKIIAIERNKTDLRHLRRMVPDLLVFTSRTIPYPTFQVPEGVDPRLFLTDFVEIFCKSHGLLDLSEGLAQTTLVNLFRERGIFEGSQNWITFCDWKREIQNLRFNRWDRRSGAIDSLVLRIDGYLQTMPELCAIQHGPSIGELCEHSFVWELANESERQTRFLASLFLKNLYRFRIARNERVSILRNLIIFDECKAAFPAGPANLTGYAPLANILSTCREVGMGFALSDQTADLNDSVFVQTRTKICMRLGSGKDIQAVERTFGLDRDQARFIPRLDIGDAIVRVPKVDEPFLIKIPRVRLQ
ncbi:MAG: hypothetical protein GY761_13185 [Hyphomicrobiales bacterium]|nr:hypothetical protein [Hyphomicrobiales bacterium]